MRLDTEDRIVQWMRKITSGHKACQAKKFSKLKINAKAKWMDEADWIMFVLSMSNTMNDSKV